MHVHATMRANHQAVMDVVSPVVEQVTRHEADLIRMKQNDRWLYVIVVLVAIPSVMTALEVFFHISRAHAG